MAPGKRNIKIHETAEIETTAIGENTVIWKYVVILPGARIGTNCNINAFVFIENDVSVGNNVTVKCGVFLWDGVDVADDVFIGPNVTFTNDKLPRSKKYPSNFQRTSIHKGASIGGNATILGGITIGEYSLIGAGSVVTKDVPPYRLVQGNPARIVGRVDEQGSIVERYLFTDIDENIG